MRSTTPRDKVITFRPDTDIFDAMLSLRERDGVPFSEQIRRALRAWLEEKQLMKRATRAKSSERS
jgi:Flp pilus assembly protein TadB